MQYRSPWARIQTASEIKFKKKRRKIKEESEGHGGRGQYFALLQHLPEGDVRGIGSHLHFGYGHMDARRMTPLALMVYSKPAVGQGGEVPSPVPKALHCFSHHVLSYFVLL